MMEKYETLEVDRMDLFAKIIIEKFKGELLEIKSKKSDPTIVIEFDAKQYGNNYQVTWEGEIIK